MLPTIETNVSDAELLSALVGSGATYEQALEVVEYRPQLEQLGINNARRWACLIGQCAHESSGFAILEENLNYSAEGLRRIWPSRYTKALAAKHARKPELIANHVYGDRMGNEKLGEGYLYRGRGPIQLTGKNNYARAGAFIALPLLESPTMVKENFFAGMMVAAWYFANHKLKGKSILEWCDEFSHKFITRRINGGYHGLNDRIARTQTAAYYLLLDEGLFKRAIVKAGTRGKQVREMQTYLKKLGYVYSADGVYGKGTAKGVIAFQKDNGLVADGIVGGMTWTTLSNEAYLRGLRDGNS